MFRTAFRRPWCRLAWSSLLLLDPALAQSSGDATAPRDRDGALVVAPGAPVDLRASSPGLGVEAALGGGPLRPVTGAITAPIEPGVVWLATASRNEVGTLSPLRWTRLIVDHEGPEIDFGVVPVPVVGDGGEAWIPPGARAHATAVDRIGEVMLLAVHVNGVATEQGGPEVNVTLPTDGMVSVGAVSTDGVGNRTAVSTRELQVDARPPTGMIAIEGPRVETEVGWIIGPPSRLTRTVDDPESGLEGVTFEADGERVDEARWTGPWRAGSHRASIRARDRVGNEAVIGPLVFELDDVPPTISWVVADGVTNDAGERYHRSPVTIAVTAEDAVAGVATLAHRAGETWRGVEGPIMAEGQALALRATDRVGNEVIQQATWRVDDTAPTIQLLRGDQTLSVGGAVLTARIGDAITVTVSDAQAGIEQATYRLNHQAVPGRRAPRPVDGTPLVFEVSGTHRLRVEARDRLGHEAVAEWRIDVAGRL